MYNFKIGFMAEKGKIKDIKQAYDSNGTLKDGVVVIIETENGFRECSISGTKWSTRCAEKIFDIQGIQLTAEQIKKINNLLGGIN